LSNNIRTGRQGVKDGAEKRMEEQKRRNREIRTRNNLHIGLTVIHAIYRIFGSGLYNQIVLLTSM
jgi:hypothetical protein